MRTVSFVLAHGAEATSARKTSSVPEGMILIHTTQHGSLLNSSYVEKMVKRHFTEQRKLDKFLNNLPKGFVVRTEGQQFVDTVLYFHDKQFWTGEIQLPEKSFEEGIFKKNIPISMNRISPVLSPPRKKISTILNSIGKGIVIVASCREVKSVPAGTIFVSQKTSPVKTMKQLQTLKQYRNVETKQAPKRKKTKGVTIRKRSPSERPTKKLKR